MSESIGKAVISNDFVAPALSIIVALISLVGVIWVASRQRKSANEANRVAEGALTIDKFEALLAGYEKTRLKDESEKKNLSDRVTSLEARVSELTNLYTEQEAQLRRTEATLAQIKTIFRRFFKATWDGWDHSRTPFPYPTDAELALLEITKPSVR